MRCSVVANVTAGPRRSPNRRASRAWTDAVDSGEPLVGRMESEHATASEDRLVPHRPQEEETFCDSYDELLDCLESKLGVLATS
jgi:hypothetical protein